MQVARTAWHHSTSRLTCTPVGCARSGEQPVDPKLITWPFAQPPPLAGRISGAETSGAFANTTAAGLWQPPQLQRPAFCDHLDEQNAAFLAYDNHPCTFLSWEDVAVTQPPAAEPQQPQQPQTSKDVDAQKATGGQAGGKAADAVEGWGADVVHEHSVAADGGLHWLWGR